MKRSFLLLTVMVLCVGCSDSPESSRARVDEMAKKVTAGMSEKQINDMFGKPDEVVKAEAGARTNLSKAEVAEMFIWRYKKLDKYYELWIRVVDGKATWAMSYDKSSKLSTG